MAALEEAERAVPIAREADERALGEALRSGATDPGPKPTERATKALDEARRQAGGARAALDGALADLIAAVERHRPEWLEALAARRSAGHAKVREAREVLSTALADLQTVASLESFVVGFPNLRWKAAPASFVLNDVDGMLERIGPSRKEPRVVGLREADTEDELEAAPA